jgi:hypothetical protein
MTRHIPAVLYVTSLLLCSQLAGAQSNRPMMEQATQPSPDPATAKPLDKRTPVPTATARAESLARVKDIYAGDFATAGTAARKSEFAGQLAAQADATKDPADRWALLTEALRLATDAGDAATAIPLIDRIPTEYAVERDESRLEALARLAARIAPSQSADLARRCLDLARELEKSADPEHVTRALTLAAAAAKKARNNDLAAEAARLSARQKDRQKVDKELEPILAKLASNPNDAELCLEAGRLLCFRAGRWDEGLPILQKGADKQLSTIAQMELTTPKSAADHLRAGDAWWDWADAQKPVAKTAAQAAAVRHYAAALAEVEGLDRARLEKRINAAVAASGGTGETLPLAAVPSVEVVGAENGMSKDGTFNGKPFTCRGKKHPSSIFTHPTDNATATIAFRLPAGVRRVRGAAGVFSLTDTPPTQQPGSPIVMRILADGEVLWTSRQLTQRDQSVPFDVELRGCTKLELHTTSQGSANTSWGAWLDPLLVK